MSDVGRYRLVYPRLWRHPGFVRLNKTARELALYLLTGPQTNRIGLFHFSVGTAAEDLSVGVETIRERLADVSGTFGWLFDIDARVFYIPSWWRWNPPQNDNVLKGNLKDLNEITPCALAEQFARNLGTLHERFHQTFVECCRQRLGQRSPIQDQDQYLERKQEQEQRASRAATNGAHDEDLLTIATNLCRDHPTAQLEYLVDHLQAVVNLKSGTSRYLKRQQAVELINLASSDLRQVSPGQRP